MDPADHSRMARLLRHALDDEDLGALEELMSDDVTWGDVADPRGCRGRRDVIANFSRLADLGVGARVDGVVTGPRGVMVELCVHWPPGHSRETAATLHQVYVVRQDAVVEIIGFEGREAALRALED